MAADRQQGAVAVLSSYTQDALHGHCSPVSAMIHEGVKTQPGDFMLQNRMKKGSYASRKLHPFVCPPSIQNDQKRTESSRN
ncbi:hypothetical protein ATANTOWER_010607 [Ataeniobius toweri]|uniref:Uncharacterized protein n=1 Tax=Ataeniobius toweri TaxID=208326 RepID=A0ABU7AFJ2_9TELE|nr:hypothetical protein [Ataeniobius toweri]